ncbi:Oidioi.mRNA.OKI2018_I69.chr2.g5125.t1.cds [Oikopleura dioica]|uniref:Oidioi.mRNA.OKI2018_I69.chr2.g5125.t1.cds n=1 Tax=Oikopleura dioica TaxID=34765 RepID=A0ABN7T3S5_OIKDI|nr:Oidioi.mRNA.OKI2018_I69.chr2.g5125.t1.cds [Oikopleura dioica]
MKWDSTARPPRCLHSCAIRTCGDNEEFKTCGTACEPTCQNPSPGVCTEQCVEECQCLEGFVRNDEGNCVRERECTPTCGENEEFKTCGTMCEKTCWSPNENKKCNKKCNENVCQCKDGFLREKGGACVEAGSCKPQARYNCKFGDLEFIDRYSTKKGLSPLAPGKSQVFICKDKKNNRNKKINLTCGESADNVGKFDLKKDLNLYFDHCGSGCSMDEIQELLGATAESNCDSFEPGAKCKFSCISSSTGKRFSSKKSYKCLCKDEDGKRVCSWIGKFKKDTFFAAQNGEPSKFSCA